MKHNSNIVEQIKSHRKGLKNRNGVSNASTIKEQLERSKVGYKRFTPKQASK